MVSEWNRVVEIALAILYEIKEVTLNSRREEMQPLRNSGISQFHKVVPCSYYASEEQDFPLSNTQNSCRLPPSKSL